MNWMWRSSVLLLCLAACRGTNVVDRPAVGFDIPAAAWSREIGRPLETAGSPKSNQHWQIDDGYWQGAPLGGFGAGSIGRTYRGDFARWHLEPGRHRYGPVPADQFSVRVAGRARVLAAYKPENVLSGWTWDYPAGAGRYHALFPYAWFVYDPSVIGINLSARQFSPIIPHDYRETSLPVGVFEFRAHNPHDAPREVSLMFTWQNMAGAANRLVRLPGRMTGIVMGPSDGEFCIATPDRSDVTYHTRFRADGDGTDVWRAFADQGRLANVEDTSPRAEGQSIGAALAVSFTLAPGEAREVPFVLAWDYPIMRFGHRRYTAFYGHEGGQSARIAADALERRREWARRIDAWQAPILADPARPDWYKSALFNELYHLVDGGTIWESDRGRFATLECFDYPFYSTLDVRFYSSFALAMLWPELEKQELRALAETVGLEDRSPVKVGSSGRTATRKRAGAAAHDIGAPHEAPWDRPNAYTWQDSNIWKDLNSKLVLQVYRDYVLTGDRSLLADTWTSLRAALEYLAKMDRDGDGLPENEGVPDQTYDTWPMRGESAYCGGLLLAALRAARAIASMLGDAALAEEYGRWFERAQASYVRKLWNGRAFNFDTSPNGDSIMADQLAGQWYARACGLEPIVPLDKVRRALRAIYENNVLRFGGGEMGPVNGMRPDGTVDRRSEQSQEVWSGVAYAVAALMLQNGMDEEAWRTAWGAYNVTYRLRGYWFRTPEAWDERGNFRASMYMRPQSIWAMEHALRER
ncbi:MAG: glucosylceramidase [Planctomycetes bacterium]|nr:glucosylceramidase [Planctomycetota bacterium]